MVRITKTMQAKHKETLSTWLSNFREVSCQTPLSELAAHLATFPSKWPFPRGDLYHWISLLNRFDVVLESFCREYKLDEGPQLVEFDSRIVLQSLTTSDEIEAYHSFNSGSKFSKHADEPLLKAILDFSRMLLQNCGNRSLYASSSHLNSLLNTTSLDLLESTLSLGLELAQRYQAAVKRMNNNLKHHASMLQNHYNLNLDRVGLIAMPFIKRVTIPADSTVPTTPATPSHKGKERVISNQKASSTTVPANDLVSLVKGGSGIGNSPKNARSGVDAAPSYSEVNWDDWGDVKISFYPKVNREVDSDSVNGRSSAVPTVPVTPTPIRRSSNLGPHGHRSSRTPNSDESPTSRTPTFSAEETQRPSSKTIEIPSSRVKSNGLHALLRQNIAGLPRESQDELLGKLRVAHALISSLETRRQILGIRLLAIANLAYIHPESIFLELTLKHDGDEPRRYQLASQLAELVHPPAEGDIPVPRDLQTIAFSTLNALAQHQSKYPDVCAALNTNVNHGVLLYVVRTAVAEMNQDDVTEQMTKSDEWRNALFSLISDLSNMPRAGADLVTAGLIPILVDILKLRSTIARRYQPKILAFLDSIMYNARDAFQTLVDANGLTVISDLIFYQVEKASQDVSLGNGTTIDQRSATVDYEIPFFQQQTIKWLFKFIHHMMTTAGGYGGNFDRLLRNLMDSPMLLGSLRRVISNASTYGSIVWSHAVSILIDFINNEPTSFAVIAEAGLSRGLLEAVTGKPFSMKSDIKKSTPEVEETAEDGSSRSSQSPPTTDEVSDDVDSIPPPPPTLAELQTPRKGPLAQGILPTSDTISIVPQAFGALCLNSAGMKMFQASGALESFFEVFESPQHVKCMEMNKDLPSTLGNTFDELVRHHPPLKAAILDSVLNMIIRVSSLCKAKAEKEKTGTKLWTLDSSGQLVVADKDMEASNAQSSLKGKGKAVDDNDVEMSDINSAPAPADDDSQPPWTSTSNESMTPYVAAVATFMSTMFSNSAVRQDFSAKGGIEYVLDLVDSPCLAYDFNDGSTSRTLHDVIAMFAEGKPHLTLPSLVRRALSAADVLAPFAYHDGNRPFFAPFINREAQQSSDIATLAKGTSYAKALVNIHSLVATIQSCLQSSLHNNSRSMNINLTQLNLGDYYITLVNSLGRILGASFREDSYFDRVIPESYKFPSRPKDLFSSVTPELVNPQLSSPAVEPADLEASSTDPLIRDLVANPENSSPIGDAKSKAGAKLDMDSPEFKNYQTLRSLLHKMSRTVAPFFQILGKSLVAKRSGVDSFQKQNIVAIADSLAETLLFELRFIVTRDKFTSEDAKYWMGMIHLLKDMLVDVSRYSERPYQTITLVLQSFKNRGGFDTLNKFLQKSAELVQNTALPDPSIFAKPSAESMQFDVALAGTRSILSFYSQLVNGKTFTESLQTVAMAHRDGRDRTRPDFFSPSQFLVELRMAVLPAVRQLWESEVIEKAQSDVSEKLIDVIRTIATADHESNALRRTEKSTPVMKPQRKTFKVHNEHLAHLISKGYEKDLAIEALYRCNNSATFAAEYCREVQQENRSRHPVPEGDITPDIENGSSSRPQTSASTGTETSDGPVVSMSNPAFDNIPALIENLARNSQPPAGSAAEPAAARNFELLLNPISTNETVTPSSISHGTPSTAPQADPPKEENEVKQVFVDDLNDERAAIRDTLIDRCLDVINAHGDVTFEVADLISTVADKSPDPLAQRKVVGETLVMALMSFAGDEDLGKSGKKVAAYAHLLALMLRNKDFFSTAVGELKDNLSTLLGFVKLSPTHSSDDPSPWIPHILLLVEMLLSEDARPRSVLWKAPHSETEMLQSPVLQPFDPAVPDEDQDQLLEAILDILPRIGKDESLALSVLRILVILTRNRRVAQTMGEKKNIQRLFVMAKQLAGASSGRFQGPLMLILRHIIEDEETIKQIMRSEIKNHFENSKNQRAPNDVLSFLKSLSHISVRAPQLFVDVTNEMVKYSRWSYLSSDASSRMNTLALKEPSALEVPSVVDSSSQPSDDTVQPTVQATEDLTLQDVKRSTENGDTEMQDLPKATAIEHKLPVVENPDGVIHFLLCELLNYKDVEDKEPAPVLTGSTAAENVASTNGDAPMAGTSSASENSLKDSRPPKSYSKHEFKSEEHPIYIYRCFILQCLTELLGSYNRTKIEFINFKRSAPPQPMTPSKPRSSVVNYLLFDLIPIGSLDSSMTASLQKKITTSSWAGSLITALLAKTGEHPINKEREVSDGDDEPDLVFVRRFVLENILKAYKDSVISSEPLDSKYARMYSLAEVMDHIMNEKEKVDPLSSSVTTRSHLQLRRLMFEKGFIAALTTSIADIDLNHPSAKRAIKQILKPLKVLTNTAVNLSIRGLITSTPGQGEEDEIESATSVSDGDNEREETPDLFRNSTLGMFEPGREDDSSSESDDDDQEMYDDEYADEMEYDEEPEDDEDNISEEDEDIEGMGPIEGLSGDHGLEVEVVMEEEEDDDDEDDDDEDEDSSSDGHDSEDDDARVEIIDEAGNIQELDVEEGMGDWEDDDGEEDDDDDDGEEIDYEGEAQDQDEDQIHGMEAMIGNGPLGELVRALGGGDPAAMEEMVERMEDEMDQEEIERAEIEEEEEERINAEYLEAVEENEDDGDDMDDEDMFLGQAYTGDGVPVAFGWEGEVDPPIVHRHRHTHRHAFPNTFPFFQGGREPLGVPEAFRYRSHRPGQTPPRALDDGTNPLLQRGGARRPETSRAGMGNWISTVGPPGAAELLDLTRGGPFGESPAAAALFEMIRSLPDMPGTIGRNGNTLQFQITTGPGQELPSEIRNILGMRHPRYETRRDPTEPGNAFLTPQSTFTRWSEEAKLLFGPDLHEVAARLRTAIESVLVPPAIEADKVKKAAEAERVRKLEEEAKKRQEEERLEKEAREAAEKLEREKEEAVAAEAAARLAAEALASRGDDAERIEDDVGVPTETSDAMEGIEHHDQSEDTDQTEEAPAEDRPRVTTVIRGNTMDITDLGIDADFLAELPEDLREEVIMTAVAERRSQAAATGAQPSEIDQEFLDALPEDIRDEIIQQERQERRRREREEQRRQAAAANGGAPVPDMDAASILATLPPALRQQVLMEQDEDMLNMLPREIADQARAAQRDHPAHQGRAPHLGLIRRTALAPDAGHSHDGPQRTPRRPMVQMLDKSGIATLLRLMFTFQVNNFRTALNSVLENVCQNRQNRIEVLGTLLSILQDGSIDMPAVERIFAQLSIRAKLPKEKDPKTPQPLKRTFTGMSSSVSITQSISEGATPLLVVQQCLLALNNLTQHNPHVPAFFLAEHDIAGGLKRSLSRKGKGKENKAGKYAINSLLCLLDRGLIMESSSIMELLSTLLSLITSPLQNLHRKQKEAEEAAKAVEVPLVAETNLASTSEAIVNSDEQPAEQESEITIESPVAGSYDPTIRSPATVGSSTPEPAKADTTTTAPKDAEKKPRQMIPPVIPEQNLKLVINIFIARECSSRTFRETLSTIKNLSAIPGAKAIFGRELISKAQGLGEIILLDLEELLPQIQKATTGTEIQGVALAKFSPGGSDQNKLLRVLTALDHLFDPKHNKTGADDETESSQLAEKQELLASLYDNSTFGPMWEKLSACLSAIRQREHILSVATILLPLIEALMVVCKNTTLKEAPNTRPKDVLLTSPPPESRMESLFFSFTEEHRKILNDLVRHTPKLMSGTFALLVKNPKVLEFDNKRNYFSRSIHTKATNTRQSFPPLQLSVRRDQVFHDSFKSLYFQTGDQMKHGKLSIRFHGEDGVDAGGVTREWFQVLSRQMFDPGYALFIPVSSDRTTFHPNQLSSINEEHLMFFKFIGRIIGKALYENRVLDCHFSRAVYKRILGKSVSVKDMESLDPEYYKSLVWMLEHDITDVITETFSVDNDKFGVVETIDFIEDGRNVPVTQENKHEYVRLMVEWRLTGSVKEQLDEFLKGFHEIIPADLVAIFNEQELELLISGLPDIDVDDWKGNTEYHNYSASSPQIQWFWRAIRSFDKEERAKLLQFVTGTSKVPLNGFRELEGMNGFSRFNIHRDYASKERLPTSHTCFNQLDLPEYESYESLRSHILTAITAGSEYFGFA